MYDGIVDVSGRVASLREVNCLVLLDGEMNKIDDHLCSRCCQTFHQNRRQTSRSFR
jgi:recombinational DNA repair protein RecT